jgi:trigger factor
MPVALETIGPCRRKLTIDIPAEQVNSEVDQVLGAYRKLARIPGFRPGKAPNQLIKSHFKKEILDEVTQRLLPKAYQEAVKEQNLKVIAVVDGDQPTVQEGQGYTFSVTVDVRPEFTLPEYKGIPLPAPAEEVTEADIDQAVEDSRRAKGRFVMVEEGSVEAGDLAQIDFAGLVDGEPAITAESHPQLASLLSAEGLWSRTDEQSFLPPLTTQLVGAPKGELREYALTLPEDFQPAELASRSLRYNVRVQAIRRVQVPELNEEFFQKEGVADLAALRERLREHLAENRRLMAQFEQRRRIQDHLLQATPFDLPEALVTQETRRLAEDFIRQKLEEGLPEDALRENADKIFQGAGGQAERDLRARFILHEIAERESLQAETGEIQTEINRLANQARLSPEEAEKRVRANGYYDRIAEDIRLRKTLDFLLSHATIGS